MEIVSRESAEHYTWGGVCDGWHLLKSSGLSVIEERVPPGSGEVSHYHERAHQFFFVLFGEATMEIEHRKMVLRPRQGVSVPPKVPHRLSNEATGDLSFIVVSAPMSHGDRVLQAQSEHVRVVARMVARPGATEKLGAILRGLVEPTRREPGCIVYELLQNSADPADFTFVEEWSSQASLEAHARSPHVQQVRAVLPDLVTVPADIRCYRVIA